MANLCRFHSYSDPENTFWTISINNTTVAKDVCLQIAAKLDKGNKFVMYEQGPKGPPKKLDDYCKILETKDKWKGDKNKFLLKDEAKPPKFLRVFSEKNDQTYWTVPIREDWTVKSVIAVIAGKLDMSEDKFKIFEVGTGSGVLSLDTKIYELSDRLGTNSRFILKELAPLVDHMAASNTSAKGAEITLDSISSRVTPNSTSASSPALVSKPSATPSTPSSSTPSSTTPTPNTNSNTNTEKKEETTSTPTPLINTNVPTVPKNNLSNVTPVRPVSMMISPSPTITPLNNTTSPRTRHSLPPSVRPPPSISPVKLVITDQVSKLIDKVFSKDSTAEEAKLYTTEYDKLIFLITSSSEQILDTALRLITNITLEVANQTVVANSFILPLVVTIINTKSGVLRMLGVWVLSNLASNIENMNILRETGALTAIIKSLENGDDETKEQALRSLTNLVRSVDNKKIVTEANTITQITNCLSSLNEEVANHALKVLVSLGLEDKNRDEIINAGGIVSIAKLLSSTKEHTLKMASYSLSALNVDGKLNEMICTLGLIPNLIRLISNPIPFVQEQIITIIANLALFKPNLEVLIKCGVTKPLVDLLNGNINDNLRMKTVWAVGNLATSEEMQTSFLDNSGLPPLISLLFPPTRSDIQCRTAWALANICQNNDAIQKEIGERGGIEALVGLLQSADMETKQNALSALVNLGICDSNEERFFETGLATILLEQLKLSTISPDIRKLAIMCLVNLSQQDKIRSLMMESGSLGMLVTLASTHGTLFHEDAIKLLTNLAINGRIRKFLQQSGISKTLQSFVDNPTTPSAIKEAANVALGNVSFPVEESEVSEEDRKLMMESFIEEQEAQEAQEALEAETGNVSNTEATQAVTVPEAVSVKQEDLEQKRKRKVRRMKIAMEIVTTERTYVSALVVLVKKFINPLRSAAKTTKPIIKEDQIKTIFSISDTILGYHQMLLEGLEARMMKWKTEESDMIGDFFLQSSDFLRKYTSYINNYNDSMAVLTECKKKALFTEFLAQLIQAPECRNMDLASFLIQPIQRIPRYILLLNDLLRHTLSDHSDYPNLQAAIKKVEQIAQYLNNNAKEELNNSKLLQVQKSIDGDIGDLLKQAGIFLREGKVRMKDNKLSFIFVCTDLLILTSPVHPKTKRYALVKKLPLKSCTLRESKDDLRAFTLNVVEHGFSCTLIWDSPIEKDVWIEEFKKTKNFSGVA